jgi:hypothetical protein
MLSGAKDNLATLLVVQILAADLLHILDGAIEDSFSKLLPLLPSDIAEEH